MQFGLLADARGNPRDRAIYLVGHERNPASRTLAPKQFRSDLVKDSGKQSATSAFTIEIGASH